MYLVGILALFVLLLFHYLQPSIRVTISAEAPLSVKNSTSAAQAMGINLMKCPCTGLRDLHGVCRYCRDLCTRTCCSCGTPDYLYYLQAAGAWQPP
ncbi:MAG: hypothetical protein ACLU38_14810 [Dysosmobacter sp.]